MSRYEEACKQACGLCAEGNRRFKDSSHCVYRKDIGKWDKALCTADSIEVWAEQQAERVEQLEREVRGVGRDWLGLMEQRDEAVKRVAQLEAENTELRAVEDYFERGTNLPGSGPKGSE